MGRKTFKIRNYIDDIYFYLADDKKLRLYEELTKPDIRRVIVNKLAPVCANVRANCNSKSKI